MVAPMMNPVMAAAGSVVMGWPRRFYASLWLVFAMGVTAMVLSALIALLSPELVIIPEQVQARTRPTFYDLLIALAAGSAGAYTIARKESGAIPGVAVAVALLPPLASAGILLTTGEYELATRAIVLFLTNLVAMVLAGALTFMALGVSPPISRKQTAAFVRGQIWLFFLLTAAVCIPLWFYSEKILFNAQYRAAKSDILQTWLSENQLELTDVDIYRESKVLVLGLAGPNPPVNLEKLYQQLSGSEHFGRFTIEYAWTQKVTGVWPQRGRVDPPNWRKMPRCRAEALINRTWVWQATQYDINTTALPRQSDSYSLSFDDRGKFRVIAACGNLKGSYSFSGRSLNINFNRNWLSGCRRDDILKLFTDDLTRARTAFVEDNSLQIGLAGSEGIMRFESTR